MLLLCLLYCLNIYVRYVQFILSIYFHHSYLILNCSLHFLKSELLKVLKKKYFLWCLVGRWGWYMKNKRTKPSELVTLTSRSLRSQSNKHTYLSTHSGIKIEKQYTNIRVAQNHKAFAKICPIAKFRTFLESLDHSTSKSF